MQSSLTVKFKKISHKGAAVGECEGKTIKAYGILPGEKAEVSVERRKRKALQCRLINLISSSPNRRPPREAHYLSCSPWQVFSYDYQVELKSELIRRIFRDIPGGEINLESFFPSPLQWGCRTKMEFSFVIEKRKLMLAFNERGNAYRKSPLPYGCVLAGNNLNKTALSLADIFNRLKLTGGEIKTLTVRESKYTGGVVALLTVKDRHFKCENLLNSLPDMEGFITAYSDPKSPSSIITEVLHKSGKDFLEEKISGKKFTYHYDGFFQNNIPQIEKALEIIRENTPRSGRITELYSGAGVIGISLYDKADEILGVEVSESGIRHAEANARKNNVSNYKTLNIPAEKTPSELLESSDVLIMDPPRSGAAPKLLRKIYDAAPANIIYLSCNPATQARDYGILKGAYRIEKLYGFDFQPQTPHIESLLILKKR